MKAVIVGAGTYGEVYLFYLKEAGYEIIGFIDDDQTLWNTKIQGVEVLGGIPLLYQLKKMDIGAVFCPIGNNKLRVEFLTRAKALGFMTPNYIHPSAIVPSNLTCGEGVYILPGVKIMPYVILEDFVMVSMGAHIAHHSKLCKGTFISTGVDFGASITCENYSYIGIGATIMTGVKRLGVDCMIGAGAVVIKDVPDNAIMAGVPAKLLRIKD